MSHEEDYEEREVSDTAEHMKGNFKKLYNMKYGDIARMNNSHMITPDQLFELAVKYFTWADNNHIKACETASFQGFVRENRIHKTRVFTLNGFQLFSGFSGAAMVKWRKQPGFDSVMEFIDSVIYEQKFQLAANGIINANFIGKEIGIDKPAEIAVTNSVTEAVTPEVLKDAIKDVLGEI